MATNESLATLVAQLRERRAQTFQERIKSLDIRDEIWRKYIVQNKSSSFDPVSAQRTGLSPDMCCERERLTREFQRLCKSYEYDPDTRALNHSLMVTEYSRASADQAMPSPYDLRSGPVLLHTMNYLITNIMDKFDQEREQGDWYNFLWDRLRAIRKELTQQHLRDEVAVEILELCARFHIFCSAFLSEYSRDLFDRNLNDKMLIDCLNQLHECYISHKKSNNTAALKNLAEFSSYMLLINLKEDNETLLRIRKLIQDSTQEAEISVALDIHRALLMNNTTKFFALIENKATLLQSCLLHRYFNVIRIKRLNRLISSGRNGDEFNLGELTTILGMDDEEETKDFLEQLGYSVTASSPVGLLIPATPNQNDQQPINRLSQKLIRSKYQGNLKDIITNELNTAVIIADKDVENSFDIQGYFIGKLPVDLNACVPVSVRRALPDPPQPRVVPPNLFERRPPSDSALRSMAATTTVNTFATRTRNISTANLFTNATTTTPTVASPPSFHFGGFPSNSVLPASNPAPNPFTQGAFPKRIFDTPATPERVFPVLPQPAKASEYSSSLFTSTIQPLFTRQPIPVVPSPAPVQPPPRPISRRLSTHSMDAFIDEIYEELLDPFIRETTYTIYDELISQWNDRMRLTMSIYDEFLRDEMSSITSDCLDELDFHQKLLADTLREHRERHRKKYLQKKYFSIWFDQTSRAQEERWILTELQLKFQFSNNEQLLEFLAGLQLISEHDLSVEETADVLRLRRYLKHDRQKELALLSGCLFEELLHEECHSIVTESNEELRLREQLLEQALDKQAKRRRERYLHLKYFSLWHAQYRQRKKRAQQQILTNNNNKRLNRSFQLRSNKKLKDHHQQYQSIKNSFEQLNTDLEQLKSFADQLLS